jgi:hypothetical protein
MLERLTISLRYLVAVLFLKMAVMNDIHSYMSVTMYEKSKYIIFFGIIIIAIVGSFDFQTALLLFVTLMLYINIVKCKQTLRELFIGRMITFNDNQK